MLSWNSAAPIGFLEIEKGLTALFGDSEHGLPAAPFVASVASVLLFVALAPRLFSPTQPRLLWLCSRASPSLPPTPRCRALCVRRRLRDRAVPGDTRGSPGRASAMARCRVDARGDPQSALLLRVSLRRGRLRDSDRARRGRPPQPQEADHRIRRCSRGCWSCNGLAVRSSTLTHLRHSPTGRTSTR